MDIGIATRLRRAGLEVREVSGWKTRTTGNPFNPIGGVNHHTAGHPTEANPTPSLGVVTNGRSDLSGPLANVLLGFDGIFYVVAAGACNHAGPPGGGVCRGMHFNGDAYSIEVEHDGLHPLEDKRVKLLATGWAAILRGKGILASQLVQHWEWAPSRKVDLGTNMHPSTTPTAGEFRGMVALEIKRLNAVKAWTVSFKNAKGDRVEATAHDLEAWTRNHPGAFQRGRVITTPKRA